MHPANLTTRREPEPEPEPTSLIGEQVDRLDRRRSRLFADRVRAEMELRAARDVEPSDYPAPDDDGPLLAKITAFVDAALRHSDAEIDAMNEATVAARREAHGIEREAHDHVLRQAADAEAAARPRDRFEAAIDVTFGRLSPNLGRYSADMTPWSRD